MKTITVLGWYDKGNCGDESYKLSFSLTFPNYNFKFTDKISPSIVKESDGFVLGGGDVLSEPSLRTFKEIKKPKNIISVSANVNVNPELLKDFKNIFVRDLKSLEILKEKKVQCSLYPDLAFNLKADKNRGKSLIEKHFKENDREKYENVVAVIINGFLPCDEANSYDVRRSLKFHQFSYDLAHVADYTNASFLFLAFGQEMPWDDRMSNFWISSKCKWWKKNLVVLNSVDVQDTLDMISACNATISTRLHSTIFSIVGKTPFIDITHNHKNTWLLETLGKNNCSIPYNCFDVEKCKNYLNFILKNGDKESEGLIDNQRELLKGLDHVRLL